MATSKARLKKLGLDKAKLISAYRSMKTIREFEERINTEVNNGRLAGFYHLYSGQEANAAGVCEHLGEKDSIISTHRGHGHCIARGANVAEMMLEMWGSSDGLCKGRGGTMHVADVNKGILGANGIVGGGPPISVGAALSGKMNKDNSVHVSFSGDGSVNQGTVFEAMNLAVVLQVPALFVVEDNFYGEFTGRDYQTGCDDLRARTEAFGMPVKKVDGSDFFEVYETAGEMIEYCRSGKGPAGLILEAGRFHGHFTGDPEPYRPKGEVKYLRKEKDPLKKFAADMGKTDALSAKDLAQIDDEVMALIDEAVDAAIAGPRWEPSRINEDVYVSY